MNAGRVVIVISGDDHVQKLFGQKYLKRPFNWAFYVLDTRTYTLLTNFEKRLAANHIMQMIFVIFTGPFRRSALLRGGDLGVLSIYENFQDFAFSVLLLAKYLSLLGITHNKKGSVKAR